MSTPIEFVKKVTKWGDGTKDAHVEEVGFGVIAKFAFEATADAYVAHLTREHTNGRVAQGQCSKGKRCDRDRIHDIRYFLTCGIGREVVLCPEHEREMGDVAEIIKANGTAR